MDREAWCAAVHGSQRIGHNWIEMNRWSPDELWGYQTVTFSLGLLFGGSFIFAEEFKDIVYILWGGLCPKAIVLFSTALPLSLHPPPLLIGNCLKDFPAWEPQGVPLSFNFPLPFPVPGFWSTQFCNIHNSYRCWQRKIWWHQIVHVRCLVAQLYPTLWDPVDYGLPGSSVHGILLARTLEWVAMPDPWDLPNPGIEPTSPKLQVDSLLSESPWKTTLICKYVGLGVWSMVSILYVGN